MIIHLSIQWFLINVISGLDDVIQQYVVHFKDKDVNGKKLMMLTHYDLEKIGVRKLGHQELILEAVDLLRSLV